MSIEVDVDAVTAGEMFDSWESKDESDESKSIQMQDRIFSPPYYPEDFEKSTTLNYQQSQAVQRADAIVKDQLGIVLIKRENDKKSGGDYEVGGSITFSDRGVEYDFYGKGKAHDDRGNHIEGKVTYTDRGETKFDYNAGHESDPKNR